MRPLLVLSLIGHAAAQPITSTFDTDAQGWRIATRLDPSGTASAIVRPADHTAADGLPPGAAQILDPDDNWTFFLAPPDFLGDRSAFLGGALTFDIRTTRTELAEGRWVILRAADGAAISTIIPTPPLDAWDHAFIPFVFGPWRPGANPNVRAIATEDAIRHVLAHLDELAIGAEYGSDALEELVRLDNPTLRPPCPPDLGPDGRPDGRLDIFDILTLFELFANGDPRADLAPPAQTLDIFDILAFFDAFANGC